jgi:hypothetical protein
MVHLPGKHALSCTMKKFSAVLEERSNAVRGKLSKLQDFGADARATHHRDDAARRLVDDRSTKFLRSDLVRHADMLPSCAANRPPLASD